MQWKLEVAWLLFLWALGVADIRNLSVSKPALIYGGILAVVSVYVNEIDSAYVILGGVLGCVFILVSRYTKEALGYGDSMMITIVSVSVGAYVAIYTLASAFGMAAVYGGWKKYHLVHVKGSEDEKDLTRKDANKVEIPFLPFLAMACTLRVLLC